MRPANRMDSWNMEHLGYPASRYGGAAGIAQDTQDLAEHVEPSGVDVLALQEIGDKADPGRVAGSIIILAVLPSPVGPDSESESVTIANGGASDVERIGAETAARAEK